MGKKIIVAGAGHGGLMAAAKLSEAGFDVTVYERNIRENMGYDWQDAVDFKIFAECGMPIPDKSEYSYNGDTRFYNPSMDAPLFVKSKGSSSTKIERKKLYDYLISFAEDKGVKIIFNTEILGPIMDGLRVIGIKTFDGDVFGDLIIDAAGINSPLRRNLPVCCNVDRDYDYGECFYAYRGYFNKIPDHEPEVGYEVFLLHFGEKCISWVVTEDDCVDVLIGKMRPMSKKEVSEQIEKMREFSPQIGTELLRGGTIEQIPIRRPLSVMVADGYAAIGDSAYMTVPMVGSGIYASLRAGLMLAETVKADLKEEYSVNTLWSYNYKYITHFGKGFASIDILKNILICLDPKDVDFLFQKQIITNSDMSFTGDKGGSTSHGDILGRALRGMGNLPALLRTASALTKGDAAKKVYENIPKDYNEQAVLKWKKDVISASVPMER